MDLSIAALRRVDAQSVDENNKRPAADVFTVAGNALPSSPAQLTEVWHADNIFVGHIPMEHVPMEYPLMEHIIKRRLLVLF